MNRQPYLESQTYGCVAHAPNKGMCQSVSVHVRSLICLAGHPHGSDVYCWLGSWNSLASVHRGLYYSYCNAPGEKYYVASEWGVIDIHFTCVYSEVLAFSFEAWAVFSVLIVSEFICAPVVLWLHVSIDLCQGSSVAFLFMFLNSQYCIHVL